MRTRGHRLADIDGSNTASKRALITGVAGQDGSYLAELLLAHNYDVHGVVRGDPATARPNLSGIADRLHLHATPLEDEAAVTQLIADVEPDEVYNLAAASHVHASWDDPVEVVRFFAASVAALFEGVHRAAPGARVFQASSSEIFRGSGVALVDESTPPAPRSPYGVGKLVAHGLADTYRHHYAMHISCGILFNHESPRRPSTFVTQTVVRGAVRIKRGDADELRLGDLGARRDWGYAGDYVQAMHLMVQQDEPDDYVIATGETHSVDDLVRAVFELLELDSERHVAQDASLMRGEDSAIAGDSRRARNRLGWEPSTTFHELLGLMVDAELAREVTPRA